MLPSPVVDMASQDSNNSPLAGPDGTEPNHHNQNMIAASNNLPSSTAQEPKNREHGSQLPMINNVFYNEQTLKYMKIIDMYKKLGIGKDIELPRLVIAGAQSCGKSSLLENLTGLPVPITTGIGTRFPIEITLIEDSKRSQTKPSIILNPKARDTSTIDKKKVEKFNLAHVYHEPMTQTEFEDLLRQVSDILGVPPPVFASEHASGLKTVEAPSQISSHVFQIEMRGKDFKSLSFVDTPGLYHAGNSEQDVTSVDDIENLVTSLIAEKRTLVIAVMEATQSTVGQKIFKFADDADPKGERTIGVMTKCDLAVTSETDAFDAILRRARNQERILKHGWYIVKNRSSTETKANVSLNAARTKEMTLFTQDAWSPSSSGLQCDRMGILSLRTGLSNVFCAHIRAEFPAFNMQTRTILYQKRSQLADLGQARNTPTEQRDYLRSIVDSYQRPKTRCLTEDFGSSRNTKEAALALERKLSKLKKTKLRDSLKNHGAVRLFQSPKAEKDNTSDKAASLSTPSDSLDIYTWINCRYQETKSSTIPGLIPYRLVERLFKEQTANWMHITDKFVESVKDIFLSAVSYCLRTACANEMVFLALERLVHERIDFEMRILSISCYDLIESERTGMQVIACEEQFVKDIRNARTLRFISAIDKLEKYPFLQLFPSFPTPSYAPFGSASTSTTTALNSSAPKTDHPSSGLFGSISDSSAPKSLFGSISDSSAPKTLFGSISDSSAPKSLFGSISDSSAPKSLFGSRSDSSAPKSLFGSRSDSSTPETDRSSLDLSESIPQTTQTTFKTLADFAKANQIILEHALNNDCQVVYEIHDILKAYYAISVQNYTDMVCKNKLNERFSNKIMDLFSMEFVNGLSDFEVDRIADENPADRKKRRELKEDVEKLEMAIWQSEAILREPLAT